MLGYELRFVLVNTDSNLESKPEATQEETQHDSILGKGKGEEDFSQEPAINEQNAAVLLPTQPQMQNLTAPTLDINKGIFPPLRNPFFGSSEPLLKPPNTQELQNEYNEH